MPNWVTHLGTTYLAAGAAGRLQPRLTRLLDMRYLLLGALLPDATRFTVILVDVLDWPAIPTFTYLIPFHSLLIIGLLAGAIALVSPVQNSGKKTFGLIMVGAAFHFLLDDLEGSVGCGSTTFYPLYFGKPINGWNSEGNFATMLLVVAAIGIGVALGRRGNWPPLAIRLTWPRLLGAAGLVALALIIPLFFRQWMIDRNAYYLGFVTQPQAFEGHSVELCFSEVIATEPLTIEEFDTPFVLDTDTTFAIGDWISVRGIYQNGAIHPTTLVQHRGFSDVSLSLVAAIAFVILVFDFRWLKRVNGLQNN